MAVSLRWTVADLETFPEPLDDKRYEIVDGELFVSTQPSWQHQSVCTRAVLCLGAWSDETRAGRVHIAPGVIFSDDEAVAPDVVWTSSKRLPHVLGNDGKFHAAPDLVVEVLSPGAANERRDRDTKLGLYARRGVFEYWLVDWARRLVQLFRREEATLRPVATLYEGDILLSPLLPGFACHVDQLFSELTVNE